MDLTEAHEYSIAANVSMPFRTLSGQKTVSQVNLQVNCKSSKTRGKRNGVISYWCCLWEKGTGRTERSQQLSPESVFPRENARWWLTTKVQAFHPHGVKHGVSQTSKNYFRNWKRKFQVWRTRVAVWFLISPTSPEIKWYVQQEE